MIKESISYFAIAITFIAFVPYIQSIRQGITKPHVFSWVIWGSTTLIVFFAQLADKGGVGAWPIGVSGVITFYVAFLAYLKKADTRITKSDYLFLLMAMSALPLWFFTADPLWAVVILTLVDTIGFAPTFRASYRHPFEEQLSFYLLMAIRNIISIFALEHYSITTILFPAVMAVACIIFIVMVAFRRYLVNENK